MKKISEKSKAKKRSTKKPAGTDFEALIKSAWEIHNTFGHKFTQKKLKAVQKKLWG